MELKGPRPAPAHYEVGRVNPLHGVERRVYRGRGESRIVVNPLHGVESVV